MEYAISVTDTSKVNDIEKHGLKVIEVLEDYTNSLKKLTSFEAPRGIVFHDLKSATELYSDIPIPAYTSRDLIHMSPDPSVWKELFLSTVDGEMERVKTYYASTDILDVAAIAAHELTHHADFFHDDFEGDDVNMWFEEGLCEYIPRKLLFSEEKFNDTVEVEKMLIQHYKDQFGEYCLSEFGKAGYRYGEENGLSGAFYDYWRSKKIVKVLVEDYFDDQLSSLIACYKQWDQSMPLHKYFTEVLALSTDEAKKLWLT
ncbi:hypothetical protein [Guptibacillus algicola]|uniref:hypothetical protein n=1 Tax=Guptibacillus algicola TaxID=225844 RepID=UPI001CD25824|nr:hypothetical protein [Alkalihalobacillus algicola]MCA0988512.1 hypothetical protein [Alkalihalobacillus algicola]